MSEFNEPSESGGRQRTGWAELGSGETVQLARPVPRLGARILDAIIVTVIYIVLVIAVLGGSVISGDDSAAFAGGFVALTVVTVVVGLGYEVAQTAVWGQTLGKRMVGIKVIHAAHGGVPGWGKAIGRWALPGLVALIPVVGWLLAILCYVSLTWDRVYQGWHDKAAGTLVIKT